MTTLTVIRSARGVTELRLAGHAGYAESGSDIVCAAISVLTSTCANALETVARVMPGVKQSKADARTSISLPPETGDEEWRDAQTVILTALQGFNDIAAQYPKHLKIIDGRNQQC